MTLPTWVGKLVGFIKDALSDKGTPSSSRVLSVWLSVSSMGLIGFCVRHMMTLPVATLQVWMGGLPMIIGALATFAASPYGINRLSGMFDKKDDHDHHDDHKENQ
jgi:hypothetical protein